MIKIMGNKKYKIKILCIIIFVIICLCGINNSYAVDELTEKLYQDITINTDGSITVKEAALLSGEYNGREREIEFLDNDALPFTGKYINFTGSCNIYNGSEITDITIYDISQKNFKTIDDINKIEKVYEKVKMADNGKYGVYTVSENTDGIDFRIYCTNRKKKVFCMEYTVKDVVVVHNDVAEIYWNVLGSGYREKIRDFQVRLHLPSESKELRVWTHGPTSGINEIVDSKTIFFKDYEVKRYNSETIRVLFDKELVPDVTKFSNVNAKEHILKYESDIVDVKNGRKEQQKIDNIINIEKNLISLEEYPNLSLYNSVLQKIEKVEDEKEKQKYLQEVEKYKQNVNEAWKKDVEDRINRVSKKDYKYLNKAEIENIEKLISNGFDEIAKQEYYVKTQELKNILELKNTKVREKNLNILYIIFTFVTIIVLAKLVKHINEKNMYKGKYYRDFPSEINPYVLEYLMKRKITNLSFSATILNLIAKKVIKLEVEKVSNRKKEKENIKLILVNTNYIGTESEKIVLKVLFNMVSNNSNICDLEDLKSYGQSESRAKKLIKELDKFKKEAKEEAKTKEYFKFLATNVIAKIIVISFWIFAVCICFGLFYGLENVMSEILIYLLVVNIICFIYLKIVSKDKNRSKIGKIEYAKWMAHKRFLQDFSKFDDKELPDVILWEKYLVTATVLQCADKVEKRLKLTIDEFNDSDYYLLSATALNTNLVRTINNSVNTTISTSNTTISASSSGGGYGGGSSGGGSGGGGGGGGRF